MAPPTADEAGGPQASVVVNAERPVLSSTWVVSGRLRLRREVQTQTRTVEVTVRREVLIVDYEDAFSPDGNAPMRSPETVDEPPVDRAAVTVVLHEEVPHIVLETVPYEVATANITRVVTEERVGTQLAHERIALDTTPGVQVPPELDPRT